MAGNTPRGIRKRLSASGQPRYQVRYLVRDASSSSGWAETSATFATLREAKAFKADRDNEAARGHQRFDPRLGRMPLDRVWQQYSASKKPAVSPKTWSGYTQHWELRIGPRFGHVPVDEISRTDVQQFLDALKVGVRAKNQTLRLLRAILDLACEDGRIHRNPVLGVSAGRIPERERHRYLSAPEVATLAAACGKQGDVVTILAYTGLRWSNLSAYASAISTSRPSVYMSTEPPPKSPGASMSVSPRRVRPDEPCRCHKWSSMFYSPHLWTRPRCPGSRLAEGRHAALEQLAPTRSGTRY